MLKNTKAKNVLIILLLINSFFIYGQKELEIEGEKSVCAPDIRNYSINFRKYKNISWETTGNSLITDIEGINFIELSSSINFKPIKSIELKRNIRRKLIVKTVDETYTFTKKDNLYTSSKKGLDITLTFERSDTTKLTTSLKAGFLGVRGNKSTITEVISQERELKPLSITIIEGDTIKCGKGFTATIENEIAVSYKWSSPFIEDELPNNNVISIDKEDIQGNSFIPLILTRENTCGEIDQIEKTITIDQSVNNIFITSQNDTISNNDTILADCDNSIHFDIKSQYKDEIYTWILPNGWGIDGENISSNNTYTGNLKNVNLIKTGESYDISQLTVFATNICQKGTDTREFYQNINLKSGYLSSVYSDYASESCSNEITFNTYIFKPAPFQTSWRSENNEGSYINKNPTFDTEGKISNTFTINNYYNGKLFVDIVDSKGCIYTDSLLVKIKGLSDDSNAGWLTQEISNGQENYTVSSNITKSTDGNKIYFIENNILKYFEKNIETKKWQLAESNYGEISTNSKIIYNDDKIFYVNTDGVISFRSVSEVWDNIEHTLSNTQTETTGDNFKILSSYNGDISSVYITPENDMKYKRVRFDFFENKILFENELTLIPHNDSTQYMGGLSNTNLEVTYWKNDKGLYSLTEKDGFKTEKFITKDSVSITNSPEIKRDNNNNIFYKLSGNIILITPEGNKKTINTSPYEISSDDFDININTGTIYYINNSNIYQLNKSSSFSTDSVYDIYKSSSDENSINKDLIIGPTGDLNPLFVTTNNKIGELYKPTSTNSCFYPSYTREVNIDNIDKKQDYFPNPVKNTLHTTIDEIETIKIYTIEGKLLHTNNNTQNIDFSTYKKGSYIIITSIKDAEDLRTIIIKE